MPYKLSNRNTNIWIGMMRPIMAGLSLSQALATIAVRASNQLIWSTSRALETGGYVPIPTGPAMDTLKQFGSAFWGGLFFTLSIGTGLTLAAWAAIWVWDRGFSRNRFLLAALAVAWIALLIWINSAGPAWLPSLFVLLVPPATAWVTARGLAHPTTPASWRWVVPAATLALLTVLWTTQFNQGMFITIRDHILLSNPAGQKVNDFYYRYTLYAAEVFKSFSQKTIRTYRWTDGGDAALKQKIDRRLQRFDILPLESVAKPDVLLSLHQGKLVSASRNGGRIEFDPARLINDTSEWLKRFSRQTDRLAVFRRVTLYGLLVGFPILLYVLIYAGWRALTSRILTDNSSRLASSALCLTMGIMLLLPMLEAGSEDMTPETLASNLASGAWPKRVAALRYIERRKIDIAAYPQYRSLVDSPRVVERYWLARSMAASRAPSTMPHLTALTRDPHPNVVCQAYFALGRRKMPRAIQTIRRQMQTSDHWYTQWYGYRAMRSLGWQQRPSK